METPAWYTGCSFLDQTRLQDSVPTSGTADESPKVCGTCEPSQNLIVLPKPSDIPMDPVLLCDTMEMRRTVRDYSDEPLMKWELSLMLHYTQVEHMQVPTAGSGLIQFPSFWKELTVVFQG